jgi:hypothetical protein
VREVLAREPRQPHVSPRPHAGPETPDSSRGRGSKTPLQ